MNKLLSELRRRNVFRVAAAYLVVGWLLMQFAAVIETGLGLPAWFDAMIIAMLAIGFPVALLLAWAFEMTPEGMQKTTPAEGEAGFRPLGSTDFVLIGLMVVVLGLVGFQMLGQPDRLAETPPGVDLATNGEASQSQTAPALSVAVLPFMAMSSNEDDGYFADGLTEEILNSLAALPELLVTSRTSAFQFKGDDLPSAREIADQLGVAHIVEGSVRRSGDRVRITVQIIRAGDDSHLWSQTYDRTMDDVFAIQEDIATNIASVLDIVLDEDKRGRMREAGVANVEAFVAYQRGQEIFLESHNGDFDNEEQVQVLQTADPLFAEASLLVPDFSDAYLLRSDQFAHRMANAGNSEREDQREAHQSARMRYFELLDLARAGTDDAGREALIYIDRVYWSDNWTGSNRVLDEILLVTGCPADNWVIDMVLLSGRVEEFIPYFERQIRCNPLSDFDWRLLSRVYYAAGQFDQSLVAIDRSLELNPRGRSNARQRAEILFSAGERDDLFAYLDFNQQRHTYYDLKLAALAGDQNRILEILSEEAPGSETTAAALLALQESSGAGLSGMIILGAQLGEHELVNEWARQRDTFPAFSSAFLDAMTYCKCGAPWDLEATPNFAARIAEAEFPWPPPGTGNFPLKDW